MFTLASENTYQDGQVIVKEGSPGDWVYVILSGNVEIFKNIDGKRVVIELLKEGEIFGELGFIAGVKRTASARALGVARIGIIDRASLDVEYNKLSSEFRVILIAIVERFKKMVDKISQSSYRTETRIKKTISLTYKDRNSFAKAYTNNISGGGLFIQTSNPLPIGEKFLLQLQLPGASEPLPINCEVTWARKNPSEDEKGPLGMGIKFLEIGPKEHNALQLYLHQIANP